MEKETFISKQTLERFYALSSDIEKGYKVYLQLVKITGRRWAYLAGAVFDELPSFPPERIKLDNDLGIVVYPSRQLFPEEREEIRKKIDLALRAKI